MKTLARLLPAVLALVCAAQTLAQNTPPPLGDLEKPPTFLYYLVAFVLLAVIVFLSILPAKRREQN